ncbi:hypothetical protein V3C99_012056 [Haemonchus contortus]
MRFLLFLILIRFHYASGDCGIPLLQKECNEDKECAKDASGQYEFPGNMTYCDKTAGHGTCCFRDNICETSDNPSSSLLTHKQDGSPYFCHENSHCEEHKKKLNAVDNYICKGSVCCSTKLDLEQICEISGTNPSQPSCSLSTSECPADEYCDVQGCCPRRYCKSSNMLPSHNNTRKDRLEFLSCTSSLGCTQGGFYNDSYCSPVEGSQKKFCCAIPYSKQFRDDGATLLPTGLLKHYKLTTADELKPALEKEADGNFSRKCEKNADCGAEEFCDEVVMRYSDQEETLKSLGGYSPKICFPDPRCAGKVYKDPSGIGLKFCDAGKPCTEANTFCDTESNQDTAIKAFLNRGFCCQCESMLCKFFILFS